MQRRIVIAPDSFKGTATASEVAAAIARGWRSVRPEDAIELLPMADGGEGTIDALEVSDPGSARVACTVRGPVGEPTSAELLRLSDDSWLVELAETSGIDKVAEVSRLTARLATTFGLGEAIRYATVQGAKRVLVALGSSASTDGGVGALMALGARFETAEGEPIPLGNAGLASIEHVDLSSIDLLPPEGIVALTDVTNPLLGPEGAAAVFGPQKGASPEDVREFDAGLAHLAEALGTSNAEVPGAGAAGGTGYGLLAIGAEIQAGALAIADAIDLPARIAEADLVITGEGSFDEQSLAGKVPSAVLNLAAESDVPVVVVAGRVAEGLVGSQFGPSQAHSLTELAGSDLAAMTETERWLDEAGAAAAREFGDA
ncbi:glycerate kinase [Gulosibacter chungangensis]|uniref:Glycerate kinase n=1 Tax=Gulosibacter chungangensis TaxID=979746 RepID=A0A7J5B9J6_9MICO|nr:glycerate kinase [Gulosibacter chungangensis]KAB1642250.1 glycerate kinase [Gulosibacter chungangensis]